MTDADYLDRTARAYDDVAQLYSDLARDDLDRLPLDRGWLAGFAELVAGGPVLEVGCGPGHTTAHLRGLGLDAFGVDVSTAMIELARAEHPELRFAVGSMDALDVADGTLGGLVSWYSLIHVPPARLPGYFAEFRRVLAPGAPLVLGFFESAGGPVTEFDHRVTTGYRWPVDGLAALAADAGFAEVGRMLREPIERERHRRGYLLLRRADQ